MQQMFVVSSAITRAGASLPRKDIFPGWALGKDNAILVMHAILQYSTVWYGTAWYGSVWYGTVQYCTLHNSAHL